MATEAELIEQKREERRELLNDIKRRRAASAQAEGSLGAAEEGQYGDVGQGGPKGDFDDEINQDPGNEDVTRSSMVSKLPEYGMYGTMGSYQKFLEEGVGDETFGSRVGGTLTKGKLFEAPSSGFGSKYSAENLPILKNMDPISRGVYNAIAPYGEKAFDILDTLFRLPGAGAADVAQVVGVDEKDVNEIQAAVNTTIGTFVPQGNPVMTSAATNQAVGSVVKAANTIKGMSKNITPQNVRSDMVYLSDILKGDADSLILKGEQPITGSVGAASTLDNARGEIVSGLNKFFKNKNIDEITEADLDSNIVNKIFTETFEKYGIKRSGEISPDTEYQRLYRTGLIDDELLSKITAYGNKTKSRQKKLDADKLRESKATLALDYLKDTQATDLNKPFLYEIMSEQYPDIFPSGVGSTRKRDVVNEMIDKKPILSDYLGLKRKIDKNTLASIDDVDSDLFKKYFNNNTIIKDTLQGSTGLNDKIVFKYLDFIRKSSPSSKKPKGSNFDDFMSSYSNEINDLKNTNSVFYKNYKLFEEFEGLRSSVQMDIKPFLDKLYKAKKNRKDGTTRTEAERISEAKNSVQIAHAFESSQINKTIGKTKMKLGTQEVSTLEGSGGLPQSYYLDLSEFNAIRQPKLETKLRKAVDKGDQQEINQINKELEEIGAKVTIDGKEYGKHIFLTEKLNKIENKVLTKGKEFNVNNPYGITKQEYDNFKNGMEQLENEVGNFQKKGININIFKDGGLVGIDHLTRPLGNF